jgi:hypothetical protein
LAANGNNFIFTDALTLSGSGATLATLDLHDNDLIFNYTGGSQLGAIEALIRTARNGGDWLGKGITSSAARTQSNLITMLGAMEATQYDSVHGSGALFHGVDPDSTAVLVKYTYYGDSDFNGAIDGDDYGRIDAGFNFGLTGWFNGDCDLSGGSIRPSASKAARSVASPATAGLRSRRWITSTTSTWTS